MTAQAAVFRRSFCLIAKQKQNVVSFYVAIFHSSKFFACRKFYPGVNLSGLRRLSDTILVLHFAIDTAQYSYCFPSCTAHPDYINIFCKLKDLKSAFSQKSGLSAFKNVSGMSQTLRSLLNFFINYTVIFNRHVDFFAVQWYYINSFRQCCNLSAERRISDFRLLNSSGEKHGKAKNQYLAAV